MTTLNIRIDPMLKKKARKVADDMGMDVSTAVKIFLVQMVAQKKIPFVVRTENGFTPAEERRLRKEAGEAVRKGKRHSSAKALLDDILGE